MKKSVPMYIMLFIIFLALVKFGVASPIISDGRTFAETGRRIVEGQALNIYDSIIGSGPYIYVPYVSIFFAMLHPLAIQTEPYYGFNIYSALSVLAISVILYLLCFRVTSHKSQVTRSESNNAIYSAIIVAIWFFGVVWESIYIGQIDLSLLLLILLSYIVPSRMTGNAILGVVLAFKPQFSILLFAQNKDNFLKALLIVIYVHLTLLALFLFITNINFENFLNLFREFVNKILSTSSVVDVTNQSLSADLNRIFYAETFVGRYWPDFSSPSTYQYLGLLKDSGPLPKQIFMIITFAIMMLSAVPVCKNIKKYHVVLIALAILPSISPLFWHVHAIYLIPVFAYLVQYFLRREQFKLLLIFLLLSFPFLLTNPFIFGNRSADFMLSIGATWMFSLICYFAILFSLGKIKSSERLNSFEFHRAKNIL